MEIRKNNGMEMNSPNVLPLEIGDEIPRLNFGEEKRMLDSWEENERRKV